MRSNKNHISLRDVIVLTVFILRSKDLFKHTIIIVNVATLFMIAEFQQQMTANMGHG